MNKVFKVVWCEATSSWVAVSEITKSQGKTKSKTNKLAKAGLTVMGLASAIAGMEAQAAAVITNGQIGVAIGTGTTAGATTTSNTGATASEASSVAIGQYARAPAGKAIAIGGVNGGETATTASGGYATAIGTGAQATADSSIAVGREAKGTANNVIALGSYATTEGSGGKAIAIGSADNSTVATKSRGDFSIAIGSSADATQTGDVVLGSFAKAVQRNTLRNDGSTEQQRRTDTTLGNTPSVAIGFKAQAAGTQGDTIVGSYAHNNFITNDGTDRRVLSQSTIVGSRSVVAADQAIILGADVRNVGNSSVAIGGDDVRLANTKLRAAGVTAFDGIDIATLDLTDAQKKALPAHAGAGLADNNQNYNYNIVNSAIGGVNMPTSAIGDASLAIMPLALSVGTASHAIGVNAISRGELSQAIGVASRGGGLRSNAIGVQAHAMNRDSIAIGTNAYSDSKEAVAKEDALARLNALTTLDPAETKTVLNNLKADLKQGFSAAVVDARVNALEAAIQGRDGVTALATLKASIDANFIVSANNFANSTAIGTEAAALDNHTIAIGTNATSNALGSIVIGANSHLKGDNTGKLAVNTNYKVGGNAPLTVIGYNTSSQSEFGDTIVGAWAKSENANFSINQATVIGSRAIVYGDQGVALGADTRALGNSSVAIGGDDLDEAAGKLAAYIGIEISCATAPTVADITKVTSAYKTFRDDLPAHLKEHIEDKVASGANKDRQYPNTAAIGDVSLAIGTGSQTLGVASNAIGANALAKGATSTAMGTVSRAWGESSIAIGTEANASGVNATAIGRDAVASGQNAISVGYGNQVSGDNSGAFGDPSYVTGSGSYSVGNNNTITTDNTFVFGSGANRKADLTTNGTGTVANSVYLGADSEATAGAAVGTKAKDSEQDDGATTTAGDTGTVANAVVNGVTYGGFAGATANGVVTVGASGTERRIQNVAAGEISRTSTDAINGSQLYAVMEKIPNLNKGEISPNAAGNVTGPVTPALTEAVTNAQNALDEALKTDPNAEQPETKKLQEDLAAAQTNLTNAPNLYATAQNVADSINASGWNAYEHQVAATSKKDTVNPGNNVVFANGTGTTANVTSDGTNTTIKYDVLKGAIVSNDAGNVTGPVTPALTEAVTNAQTALNEALKTDPNAEQPATKKLQEDLAAAQTNLTNAPNSYATAQNVANSINASGWTLQNHSNKVGLVNPGDKVNFTASDKTVTITATDETAEGVSTLDFKVNVDGTTIKVGDDGKLYAVAPPATAAENTYFHVNDGTATGGNADTNLGAISSASGATQKGAITAGVNAKATATDAMAMGNASTASGQSAVALGNSANASNTNAVALGVRANASGNVAVAIGENANASNEKSIAIGGASKSSGDKSIAVGDGANATNTHSFAMGGSSLSTGTNSVAVGSNANATANFAVALGNKANATAHRALAAGVEANALGTNSTAIGSAANASATNAIALGNNARALADHAIATGVNATATAGGAIATGHNATASGVNSIATGFNANTSISTNAVAIGRGANTALNDSVAIGSNSTTATGTAVTNAVVNGVTYGTFAGTLTDLNKVFSVGAAGNERQIQNVAAGRITQTSTDAINGSQLYAVIEKMPVVANVSNEDGKIKNDAPTNPNAVATTSSVATAVNNSYWTLQNHTTEVGQVNPGDKVNFTSNDKTVTITATNEDAGVSALDFAVKIDNDTITKKDDGTLSAKNTQASVTAGKGVEVTSVANTNGTMNYTVSAKVDRTSVDFNDAGQLYAIIPTSPVPPSVENTTLSVNDGKVDKPATTAPAGTTPDGNKLVNATTVANAINNAGWTTSTTTDPSEKVVINPGDVVNYVNGNGTTANVTKVTTPEGVDTVEVKFDVNKSDVVTAPTNTQNPDNVTINEAGKAVAPTNKADDSFLTTGDVVDLVNSVSWNAKQGENKDTNNDTSKTAQATKVNAGDDVTFTAGKNLVLEKTAEGEFIYATKNDVTFNHVNTTTMSVGNPTTPNVVNFTTEAAKPATNNVGEPNTPSTALNITSANGKPTQITGVGSSLNTTPITTNTGTQGDQPGTTDTTPLVNLTDPAVNKNAVATVGDLQNMGWVLSAPANGYVQAVKNANQVNFIGEGTTVTGVNNATTGQYDIKVAVNETGVTIPTAEKPATADDLKNNVTVNDKGQAVAPTEDKKANESFLTAGDVVNVVNNVGWTTNTTGADPKPVVINPGDAVNYVNGTGTTAVVTPNAAGGVDVKYDVQNTQLNNQPATKVEAPKGEETKFVNAGDLANTLNNLGFKVVADQDGGTNKDKPEITDVLTGDTVKFIAGDNIDISQDGKNFKITATVTSQPPTNTTLTVNNGKVNVPDAGSDAGNPLVNASTVGQAINESGWKTKTTPVETPTGTTPAEDVVINPGDTVNYVDGKGTTAVVTKNSDGGVDVKYDVKTGTTSTNTDGKAQVATGDAGDVATVGDIVNTINNVSWNVKQGAQVTTNNDTSADSEKSSTAIKAGDTVTMTAGKNLVLEKKGTEFIYATANDVEFTSIKAGDDVQNKPITIGTTDGKNVIGGLDTTIEAPTTAVAPTAKPADEKTTNAATLGDVLNAGFNVKENAEDRDVITPYETVNFVNGAGTTAVVTKTDTGVDVKYNANVGDGLRIEGDKIVANGTKVEAGNDNVEVKGDPTTGYTISAKNTQATVTAGKGVEVTEGTANANGTMNYTVAVKTDGTITTAPDGTTLTVANTTLTPNDKGGIDTPDTTEGNKLVNATTVANAINKSGFSLTANGTNSSVVNPSDTVDLNNKDGNIVITKVAENNDVTFALNSTVKVGTDGSPITINGDTNTITGLTTTLPTGTTTAAAPQTVDNTQAATLGDVLNAGWNLKENNVAKDFVKPYDTVDFVNGAATVANITMDGENVAKVKYDVQVDGTSIRINQDTGKLEAVPVNDKVSSVVNGATTTVQKGGTADAPTYAVEVNKAGVTTDPTDAQSPDNVTINEAGKAAAPTDKAGDKFLSAEDVVNVVNSVSWNAKQGENKDTNNDTSKTAQATKVNAGDDVTFTAGKNLVLEKTAEGEFIYATKNDVTFNHVNTTTMSVGNPATPNVVNFTTEAAKPATNNVGEPNTPSTALNITSANGKPTQITGVGSSLNTTPITTMPAGDKVATVGEQRPNLVDLTNVVTPNAVATVGDLQNMGWVVSAADTYKDTVKNANEVQFVGDGGATVTGKTLDNGVRQITVSVKAPEAAQLPVVYTLADGTKVVKSGDNFYKSEDIVNNAPKQDAQPVDKADVIASMNTATDNTTTPTTLTNVKGNLAPAYNTGDKTEGDTKKLDDTKPNAAAPTTSAAAPDNVANIYTNAATVGDVLNAGFNVQENSAEKDFVKAYDTVNFANGTGTTATVDVKEGGKVVDVKFNVNKGEVVLPTTPATPVDPADSANKVTFTETGKVAAPTDDAKAGNTFLTTGDVVNVVNNAGWKTKTTPVETPTGTTPAEDVVINPGDAVNYVDGKGTTAVVTKNTDGGVDVKYDVKTGTTSTTDGKAQVATGDAGDVATVGDIVNTINNVSWNVKQGAKATTNNDTSADSEKSSTAIKAGDTVTMTAGKNLVLEKKGTEFIYATANDVTFNNVNTTTLSVGDTSKAPSKENPIVNFKAEPAKDASNNADDKEPTTALNITSADGKPTQITGVGSSLDKDPITTNTGKQGDVAGVEGSTDIVNLGTPETVSPNAVATVGDLQNMGWIVGTPENGYVQAVKNAQKVNFIGEGTTVTGNTNGDAYEIKVAVNKTGVAEQPTNTADTNNVTVTEAGKVAAPTDDKKANDSFLTAGDVVNTINKSGFTLSAEGENASVVNPGETVDLNNEDGNIVITKSDDKDDNNVTFALNSTVKVGTDGSPITINGDTNTITGLTTTLPTGTTTAAAPQTVDNTQAATLGDVLNAGWNLKENNVAKDFVKPYDTVDFVNGAATVAKVEMTGDNVAKVTYDVQVDGTSIRINQQTGKLEAIAGTDKVSSVVNGDTTTVQQGGTADAPTYTVEVNKAGVTLPTAGTPTPSDANNVTINEAGKVIKPTDDAKAGNTFLTAGDVADVINNAGWTTKNTDGKTSVINPGDAVNYTNGTGTTANVVTVDNTTTVKFDINKAGVTTAPTDTTAPNDVTITTTGKAAAPTDKAGDKFLSAEDVVNVVNSVSWNAKQGANKDTNNDTSKTAQATKVNAGDDVTFTAGKNLVLEKTADGEFIYATKNDVTFNHVNTTTMSVGNPTTPNVVNFTTEAAKPATNNVGEPNTPSTALNITSADGKPTQITGVGSSLNTTPITTNTGTQGTQPGTTDTTPLVNLTDPAVNKNAVATVGDLQNMGWVLSAPANGYVQAVKNANQVNFIGEGTTVTGVNNGTNGYDIKVAVNKTGVNTTPTNNQDVNNVTINEAGKVVAPSDSKKANESFLSAGDVANAINTSGWTTTTTGEDPEAVVVNPGDTVNYVNGAGTTAVVTKNSAGGVDVKFDVSTAKAPEINNNGSIAAPTTNGGDFVNATTLANTINNVSWNVTAFGTNTTNAKEEQVKAGEVVTFEAGKNMTLTQNGQNFTYATADNVTFNNVNTTTLTVGDVSKPADENNPVVNIKTEKAQPATNNADDKKPTTALNITSADGKPTQITGVGSSLDAFNVATMPKGDGNVTPVADQPKLVNLTAPTVNSNAVATVGDLQNMGWVVSANDNYKDTVKNANEVKFVAGSGITVTGETKGDIREIKISTNAQAQTNNSQLPVVYTLADGTRVYPNPNGNGTFTTNPDGTGSTHPAGNVIASMNSGDNSTTAPTTLANVKGNLDPAYNLNSPTEGADKKLTDTPANADQVTKSAAAPTGTNLKNMYGNAATVGDVLNAGFNVQENGTAKDFVKAYDTVGFVNGTGTTANVTVNTDGSVANVTFNVNKAGVTTTPTDTADANNVTVNNNGQAVKPNDNADNTFLTSGDVVDVVNNVGWKVAEHTAGNVKDVVTAGNTVVFANGTGITSNVTTADGVTTVKFDLNSGKIDSTGGVAANTTNGIATTADVVNAINNSGWTANVAQTGSGTMEDKGGDKLVNPGDSVTMTAGDNIKIVKDGLNYTIATNKDIGVQGNLTVAGNTTLGNVTVNPNSNVNMGNNTVAGVKSNLVDVTPQTNAQPTANSPADQAVNKNNAATVGDVLNAGWNLQGNGQAVDTVVHNDTVNFVDGRGSNVAVTKDPATGANSIQVNTAVGYVTPTGAETTTPSNTVKVFGGDVNAPVQVTNVASGVRNADGTMPDNRTKAIQTATGDTLNNVANIGDLQALQMNVTNINNTINNVIGDPEIIKTYDAAGNTEKHTISIVTAINNMNKEGIRFFHTNSEEKADGSNIKKNAVDSSAPGTHATAIGYQASASGNQTVALGNSIGIENKPLLASTDPNQIDIKDDFVNGTDNKNGIHTTYINTATKDTYKAQITRADGERAIAIGTGSQALGNQTIAIGVGNVVTGENSGAFGDPNFVSGSESYAFGNNNNITTTNTHVVGNNVTVTADNSVALGNNASITAGNAVGTVAKKTDGTVGTTTTAGTTGTVETATVGGVTYGGFAGATATGAVSVGASGTERRIQNVAAGEISATSTDAINGSQLYAVAKGIANVHNEINDVAGNAYGGVAQAIATAGLPQVYLPGKSLVAVGTGYYKGETGYAVSFSSISDGGNWIFKGTGSGSSQGNVGGSVAIGYQW